MCAAWAAALSQPHYCHGPCCTLTEWGCVVVSYTFDCWIKGGNIKRGENFFFFLIFFIFFFYKSRRSYRRLLNVNYS